MSAVFPSSIASLTNPQASDRLNSPDHAAQHADANDNIEAIETKVGVDGSAVTTSLDYIIKNPSSNGGGHVQTANKGGTGQTTYTKGDLLVATSSSVLAKLAVGLDGQALIANSSVSAGVNWANTSNNKVAVSASISSNGASSVTETSIFSISVPGSVLGINNLVRANLYVSNYAKGTTSSVLFWATYGGARVASVMLLGSSSIPRGKIEYILFANQSATAQRGNVIMDLNAPRPNTAFSSVSAVQMFATGTASVQSSANQTMGMTFRFSDSDPSNDFTINGYTVEKIV